MIVARKLTKQADDKFILRGIDLEINKGETVAILGPNGAGKSTLLKVLATLIKPTSGLVSIKGLEMKKSQHEIRKLLGYLPHSSFLYDHFTPLENLVFYGAAYGMDHIEEKAVSLISSVGLSFFLNEPVKNFSRGMVQRVAIARAIIHDPEVLLLDEPHTGLDQGAADTLNSVILTMKEKGTTTLMVTHDFKQAAEICERAVVIKNGKLIANFCLNGKDVNFLHSKYTELVEGGAS
ncbi:heme ABC exporter ATP-binding protein CcmA [Mesobacillus zeae]|uniref:Heme ABC exporter ATP-binding protein CcmA n=1 Tax=Mesobacillus zeae TaxID=1917180 RepID=A0A398B227_9BACI|nr:heme ABC exporter ATP-binding protein CcmA [Mesobacillus zeae]RID83895.1 heme ABC exporter ATP-binding protein CcmA [Mesobacillus zeae]